MLAYEILCISSNRCIERRNQVEQMGIPDALALLNTEDARHLERLAWAFTTVPCWWAHGLNFWDPGPGAPCWWGFSDTSTGATRTRLIAHHRHWVPGIMNGCRHCVAWAASADKDKHPDPRGGLEAAHVDAVRCQHVTDSHRPCPLTCPRDVHMEQLYSLVLLPCATVRCYCGDTMPHAAPTTPKVASVVNVPPPIPGPATLARERLWPRSIKRRCWKTDFQTQHTPVHCVMRRGDSSSRRAQVLGRKPGAAGRILPGHRRRGRDAGNS